jgi:hypothetical protein
MADRDPWEAPPPPAQVEPGQPTPTLQQGPHVVDTIKDVAETVPSKTARGLTRGFTWGWTGDIRDELYKAGNWLDDKLLEHGLIDEPHYHNSRKARDRFMSDMSFMPTTDEIIKEFGIPQHQPKGAPARIVGAAAEAGADPITWMTGPGSAVRNITSGTISGGAGQAAEEATGSPAAGIATSLLTSGVTGAGGERAAAAAERRRLAPTGEQLESRSRWRGQPEDDRLRNLRASQVGGILDTARRRATRLDPGSGFWPQLMHWNKGAAQGVRDQVSDILDQVETGRIRVTGDRNIPNAMRQERAVGGRNRPTLTHNEVQALRDIYAGDKVTNISNFISHFSAHHTLGPIAAGLAGLFGHTTSGLALLAAGQAARAVAGRRSVNKLSDLASETRLNTPAGRGVLQRAPALPARDPSRADLLGAIGRGAIAADALQPTTSDDALR